MLFMYMLRKYARMVPRCALTCRPQSRTEGTQTQSIHNARTFFILFHSECISYAFSSIICLVLWCIVHVYFTFLLRTYLTENVLSLHVSSVQCFRMLYYIANIRFFSSAKQSFYSPFLSLILIDYRMVLCPLFCSLLPLTVLTSHLAKH